MGFWSDLLDKGAQAVKSEATSRLSSQGQSAHIAAQNEVVTEFGTIIASYHAGQLTNAQAQQKVSAAAATFTAFCQNLGYPRAIQGAADVNNLKNQLIASLQKEAQTGTVGTITGGIPAALGVSSLTPTMIALLALGAFLLLRRR